MYDSHESGILGRFPAALVVAQGGIPANLVVLRI